MILKYISIPQLNFSSSWKIGWEKIQKLSKFDRLMTLFWFLGPFIYLIERSPADIWLTLIGLIFLIRCIIKRDWYWTSQLWFKSALLLWGFGLFSAVTSPDPFFSFTQGFVWIRFPLYAAAAQVWLARDRDIRIVMLISLLICMIIMSIILIAETFYNIYYFTEPKTRLSWPYGDLVPGSYLAKTSLPIFCVLCAIITYDQKLRPLMIVILSAVTLATLLSGERMSFILLISAGILASIFFKPKFSNFFILGISIIVIFFSIFIFKPLIFERFTSDFIKQIPIINTTNITYGHVNPYWGTWRSGIQQGLLEPAKGIGPSGTRNTCLNLDTNIPKWLPGKNFCGNHPHNFYIQLFAETGIIGLIIGCVMFGSIIFTCYRARKKNINCPMSATAFVVPFVMFFPLQQFGSFYGQWGNLFTWFAIAFAISQFQGWRNTKSDFGK